MGMAQTQAELTENTEHLTVISFYGECEGYDLMILDIADTDPESGWQVRQSYLAKRDSDAFFPLAFGDGYNGFTLGDNSINTDGIDVEGTSKLMSLLCMTEEEVLELAEIIDHIYPLRLNGFHMLPTN